MKPNLQIKIEISEPFSDPRLYEILVIITNAPLEDTIEKYSISIYYNYIPSFVCGYAIINEEFKKLVKELGLGINTKGNFDLSSMIFIEYDLVAQDYEDWYEDQYEDPHDSRR